jgi:hypothetical protein
MPAVAAIVGRRADSIDRYVEIHRGLIANGRCEALHEGRVH